MHVITKFNKEACLKQFINMNAKLRKSAKKGFEKDYFKLTNNAGFGKNRKVEKHRDIKLVATKA